MDLLAKRLTKSVNVATRKLFPKANNLKQCFRWGKRACGIIKSIGLYKTQGKEYTRHVQAAD